MAIRTYLGDNLEDIYIHHHLGLGDHICMNGLVRLYAEKYNVFLFCKEQNLDCVSFMYRDAGINLMPIHQDGRWNISEEISAANAIAGVKLFRIGFDKVSDIRKNNPNLGCDEWFYMQCGIDYSVRFDGFYLERDYSEEERVYNKLNPNDEDYIFVHDDAQRGYNIDVEGRVVRNDVSENLFYMGLVIERAKEVHLMESSIRCYIEHLSPVGKLYYHDIREMPMQKSNTRKEWTIISHKNS